MPHNDPPGHIISLMKEYTARVIPNEEAKTMNCATYTDFDAICGYIRRVSKINDGSVYGALRHVGQMKCYSDFKRNGTDVFAEIAEYTNQCGKSLDIDKMRVAEQQQPIFVDVHTMKQRVDKVVYKTITDFAVLCGINTSHLNLYHALHGLKRLCENDPVYFSVRDVPVFRRALERLSDVDKSLEKRRIIMKALADA